MWLWAGIPQRRPQPHEVNQVRLFGPLFHQEALHTAKCGGNHFLPSESYLGQWRSYSRCMWPKVHIMDVNICSMCISQVEGVYMDPIKVKVHYETNLWQAQTNLVGIGECVSKWPEMISYDSKILPTWTGSTRGALGTCRQTRCFPFNHGFVLNLMMFLISKMQVRQMDSCPFHHRDPDTYIASNLIPIQSQWVYFYGCHVWHQQCESKYHLFTLMAFDFHRTRVLYSCLGYYELTNMWRFGGVVWCLVGKAFLPYARLETIMSHCGWCPTRTLNIMVGCTLIFYFLLHCLMF